MGFYFLQNVVIGGLKGYERLLSLSKDKTNPRWKPLHMAGTWNQKNRRMAKLKSKSNWFKGKAEIPQPTPEKKQEETVYSLAGSRRKEDNPEGCIEVQNQVEGCIEVQDQVEGCIEVQILPEASETIHQDGKKTPTSTPRTPKRTSIPRLGVKGKKRGKNRQVQTLGGIKKQKNALKRKTKQELNRKMGLAGFPTSRKNKEKETIRKSSQVSVLFIDNTKGGLLARKL